MSSSRLVTKKRRSNEKEDDDLRRQRSTKYKNASMRSRIDELGPICKTRKKMTSSPYEDKDCEFFKQLSEEGWPDADKCLWLSSGSSSPSSCYDDQRFYTLSDLNMSLNQQLVFVLMLLANLSPKMSGARMLPDGSFIRSLDETSFVLQKSPSTQSEGDVKEDYTVTSLWRATRNESAESFPGVASGNFSIFSNPSSVSRRESDPRMLESDKIGISAPLVDLEEENSNLNSDTEFDVDFLRPNFLDFLQPDFPSPSCKNSMVSDVQTSNSSIVQLVQVYNLQKFSS